MAYFPLVACEGRREEQTMELSHRGWRQECKGSGSGVLGVGCHRKRHSLRIVRTAVCRMEWRSRRGLVAVASYSCSRRVGVDSLMEIFGFFVFWIVIFVSVEWKIYFLIWYWVVNIVS